MPARNMWEKRIGRVRIDVPRPVGYYGGVAAAVDLGLVEPPRGIFIAGIPVIRALTHSTAPPTVRLVGEVLDGGVKPVGGDAEAVVQIEDCELAAQRAAEIAIQAGRGRPHQARNGCPPAPRIDSLSGRHGPC
jgi:hypothetical protein